MLVPGLQQLTPKSDTKQIAAIVMPVFKMGSAQVTTSVSAASGRRRDDKHAIYHLEIKPITKSELETRVPIMKTTQMVEFNSLAKG